MDEQQTQQEDNDNLISIPLADVADDPDAIDFIKSLSVKKEEKTDKYELKENAIPKDNTFEFDEKQKQESDFFKAPDVKPEDITQQEKDEFLKSILHDVPVKITVKLFGSTIPITIRARNMYQQKMIFDIVNIDEKIGNITDYVTRIQELSASLMLIQFGDRTYSPPEVNDSTQHEENKEKIKTYCNSVISGMTTYKWQVLVNAINTFEAKCQIMINMCHDGNFWNPVGQGQ